MNKLPLLTALVLSAVSAQATIVIDDFNVASPTVAMAISGGSLQGSFLAIGGGTTRKLTTAVESKSAPAASRAWSTVGGGAYTFGSDAGVNGLGRIDYRFTSMNLSGLTSVEIDLLSNDTAGNLTLMVGDASQEALLNSVAIPVSATKFTVKFDIPAFLQSGLDFAHTTKLSLYVDPSVGGDVNIDAIRAVSAPVPEPASMAALGLGVAAFLRRRRKA